MLGDLLELFLCCSVVKVLPYNYIRLRNEEVTSYI